MHLGNLEIPVGAALAPMAGVTDLAFRTVCAELGASFTVTEMVSSRALHYGDKKTVGLLTKTPNALCGVQIFGNDPEIMAEGAVLALRQQPFDFVDVNMGCPMPKIAGNGDGAGLLRDLPLAEEILKAVVQAVDVPVTVKTRLGWDKGSINAVQLAELAEKSGVAAISVHGRTKTMLYSGTADWDAIAKVKQAVSIPVIANGDVRSAETLLRCLDRSKADHVMVGRAAFGDPWLFAECKAALDGKPIPVRPPLKERVELAVRQFEIARDDKGEHIACLEARKHFAWYLHGVPHSIGYKNRISGISTMDDIYAIALDIRRNTR